MDWEEESSPPSGEEPSRPPYYDFKASPSNTTKFDLAKTGWKAWAQLELGFYALGQGYDVNLERSANPRTPSMDLIAADDFDDKGEVIYLAEIHESEAPRTLMEFLKRSVREWVTMFHDLEIS